MFSKLCGRALLCSLLTVLFSAPVQLDFLSPSCPGFTAKTPILMAAGVAELWDEYLLKAQPAEAPENSGAAQAPVAGSGQAEAAPSVAEVKEEFDFPGRFVGKSAELSAFSKNSDWPYRRQSYELYYDSSRELARAIYSLALQQKNISPDMPLERFEKGVQGFHYNTGQIIVWAQKIVFSPGSVRTREEQQLFDWLVEDGIIVVKDGSVHIFGMVRHVLGAAPGKKRSFFDNLRHERLHVYWDEHPEFADNARKAWARLDSKSKKEVYARLKGYSSDNEAQLIEEWAVFEGEKLPEAERKALVGI